MTDALYDPEDPEYIQHGSPTFAEFKPNFNHVPDTKSGPSPDPEPAPTTSRRKKRRRPYVDIEDIPLVSNLGPNVTGLTHFGPDIFHSSSGESLESSPEMKESFEASAAAAEASTEDTEASPSTLHSTPNVKSEHEKSFSLADGDVATLQAQASAGLEYEEKSRAENVEDPSLKHRVDSAQERVPQLPQEKRPPRSGRASPLPKLVTDEKSVPHPEPETITTSPILRKNMMTHPDGPASTLPPLQQQTPVSQDGNSTSPKTETLPPIRQVTSQLNDLAEVAMQQPYSHHQSPSFGSTTSQSPMLPYHYPPSNQTSPSSQYPYSAMSPTSTIGDLYGSPTQHSSRAYFHRRSSGAIDHVRPLPASLPSASSGESHGHASSTDGYSTSTAHTTPIDGPPPPDQVRQVPILPPPPGMPQSAIVVNSGFKCDWPGCTAQPFQTQYLLSSHKNVHSQNRPHYCPVAGCPRSDMAGGKGFKRKNEMIRHGLVHSSPGFICPYCPDREHRYPRPDNLQRHVRVHHVDKDKDDPALRDVLSQRVEGTTGRKMRRRAGTNASA